MQHHFVEMYADLCVRPQADLCATAQCIFRRIVLEQFQRSFQESLEPLPEVPARAEDEAKAELRRVAANCLAEMAPAVEAGTLPSPDGAPEGFVSIAFAEAKWKERGMM